MWPKKFNQVYVSDHLGAGLAPWNLIDYNFFNKKKTLFIKNKFTKKKYELIFFHYHDLKYFNKYFFLGGYKISIIAYLKIYKDYKSLYLKEIKKLKKITIFKDFNFADNSGVGKIYIINLIKKILYLKNLKFIK